MSENKKERDAKFKEACPEGAKELEKNNSGTALDIQLRAKLTNTAWQKGLTWRNEKVQAVAEARRRGVSEKEIFKQLKRAGLVDATARDIMNDAFYLED
jgi:hypothetical protein